MDKHSDTNIVLKQGNLFFRKPCLDDVCDLLAVKNDTEAALLLGGVYHQYTEQDIVNWINFHNSQADEVLFVVIDTDTGKVIGHAGLYKIDSRIRRAEYGILIGSKSSRGRGYGTRITSVITNYGFTSLGLHKIKALVLKENYPSLNMLRKCGYVEEGVLVDENYKNDRYYDVIIMSIINKESLERI